MGKSTLASALADLAGDRFVFLWGHADIFANAAAPFATWRPIFAEIFTYQGAPDALLADVHGALERQGLPPERAGYASLSSPCCPLGHPTACGRTTSRASPARRLPPFFATASPNGELSSSLTTCIGRNGGLDAGRAGGAGRPGRAPGPPRPARARRGVAGHGEAGAHNRRPPATGPLSRQRSAG